VAFDAGASRRWLTILVVAYWLALFTATHVRRIPKALQMPGADKWQHTVAFAGLAFLLAGRRSYGKPLTWKAVLGVACVVVVYGAFDELTQIPVGRFAEFNDWLADTLGALLGLSLYAGARQVFPSLFRTAP
jgi:VanZ family protein